MSASTLERPVWRRFRPRWLDRAASHVRAGGLAAIVEEREIRVILPVNGKGKITELGLWALLAIEQRGHRRIHDGPAKGLVGARIHPDYEGAVLDWCERDSIHPEATRTIELDCTKCAACCREANVLLDEDDLARFRSAGRKDLTGRAYIRRHRDGRIVLRFADDKRCQMLRPDNLCGIYEIRPDNCRAFVMGSEACLAAREDTLGLRDGAPVERVEVVELGRGGGS
jgi:hypothetical protein